MTSNGLSNGSNRNQSTLMQVTPTLMPSAQPRGETVLVTPAMAEVWLTKNVRNRKIRKARVKAFARDLVNGNWTFNPQPISFGVDGTLLDGQHRLTAVVESGVSAYMVIWVNVPPSARTVMDIGTPRNIRDIGEISNRQSSIAAAMMRGRTGGGMASTTMAEKLAFYHRFATEIDFVIGALPATKRGVRQAPVSAAICRALFHMKREDIEQFCRVLESGMPTGDTRDATVIRLRDRLMVERPTGGMASQIEAYLLTCSALKAFHEKRVLSKIYLAATDPFPLPDAPRSE